MNRLCELLVAHAYHHASHRWAERCEAELVTKELGELAGQESDPVHRAWEHCMQCYAEQADLAWLRAATYLLPLELRCQRETLATHRKRLAVHSQRMKQHREAPRSG